MLITDVKPCKKSQKAIYIDGEFYANIDSKTFCESSLEKGSEVSSKDLENLIFESNFRRAKERALYLLSYRDYSKNELKNKLQFEFGEDASEKAISNVEELGYINDEVYTRNYANKLFNTKGYAEKRVRYELIKKGIGHNIIDKIISEFQLDPKEKILSLLNSKYSNKLSTERDIKRTIASLQRHGYSFEDIKAALQEFCNKD